MTPSTPCELISREVEGLPMTIVFVVFQHLRVPGPVLSASVTLLCPGLRGQCKR